MYSARLTAAILLIAFAAVCPLHARLSIDSLHVQRVHLATVAGEWLEFAVVLRSNDELPRAYDKSGDVGGTYNLRLALAYRDGSKAGEKPVFAEGAVNLPGRFEGLRTVFFYLDPEFVEAYQLDRTPLGWRVSLTGHGENGELVAPSLEDPARRASFLNQLATAESEPLLPIYLTPFYSERYPEKLAELPSMRRGGE